jgi:hypothetical protein
MNRDDKTMLALAALTYRGFGLHSEAAVDTVLRRSLPNVEAEGLGRWDLVWGPATFRVPTSFFDDAMMYVAREARPAGGRARYVIAIRGTNPVSMFDWVFGDLWVRLPVSWTPAAAGPPALISASTAMGLAIIQHLAAETPPSKAGRLASIGNSIAGVLQELASRAPELEPRTVLTDSAAISDEKLIERIEDLSSGVMRSQVVSRLSTRFAGLKAVQAAADRAIFDQLLRQISASQGLGETLLQFLNRAVGQNANVVVTGHSKGGALAIAAALWLAETWAPARQAEVECYSFAGPTAGNAAFAQRYNARLGNRTRRIVNPRDVVPQAWVPENLDALRGFYPILGPAITTLTDAIAPLGHTHVGGELIEVKSKDTPGNLLQKLIYNHLDAYLADAAFQSPKWTAENLFLEP